MPKNIHPQEGPPLRLLSAIGEINTVAHQISETHPRLASRLSNAASALQSKIADGLDGRAMASRIFKNSWLPQRAAPLPVDPALIAQQLGVKVFLAELPSAVSGALVKKGPGEPMILLNSHHHINQLRFTCAHELGHYLHRATKDEAVDYEYIDWSPPRSFANMEPEEVYANTFAFNLLMPKNEIIARHKDGLTAAELVIDFRVSVETIQERLAELDLGGS